MMKTAFGVGGLFFAACLLTFKSSLNYLLNQNVLFLDAFGHEVNLPHDDDWTLHERVHARSGANGSCWSIKDRFFYYPPSQHKLPFKLKQYLRDYEAMHKRCVGGVNNWDEHFRHPEDGLQDCKYILWLEITSGLGNKFGSLLSAFTYALLTNRAIIVDTTGHMNSLVCNPFPSSSWWLPDNFPLQQMQDSTRLGDYVQQVNANGGSTAGIEKNAVLVNMEHWYDENDAQFFCDYAIDLLDNVTWTAFDSNQNTIMGFYLVPKFREKLNELIPDRAVMTHTARYLLNPTNFVWERITRVYNGYLRNAETRIGLQVRTGSGYDPNVTQRIISCLSNEKILPNPSDDPTLDPLKNETADTIPLPPIYSVFIASLDFDFYLNLKEYYGERPAEDHSIITIHTESVATKFENHNLDANQVALSEIWLLSMSDTLLISYHSTFGYLASALAGRDTFFMNICNFSGYNSRSLWRTNSKPICERVWSYNGCFHVPPGNLTCQDKTIFQKDDSSTWLPYVRPCQDEDNGFVLIPTL